ncbi:MAG: hypothetical protein OSB62_02775 [Alphaproteobacteria bacterium]|nr:hypothetical protein [Alphaproteobacteria bacterium]
MNRFLIGAALATTLVLAGCGDDEEEKQKARIAANAALLTAQQEKITETVPQIAQLTARLNSLQEELAASEVTIAEKNAAEARLAELQAKSTELQSALTRIEEFQARAKLVNPETGDSQVLRIIDATNGKHWNVYRRIEPAFNIITYKGAGQSGETLLSKLSEKAAVRINDCLNGAGCITPQGSVLTGISKAHRVIDWDAGTITYINDGAGSEVRIYPFEHFGEDFAQRMHAEADELRTQLTSQ